MDRGGEFVMKLWQLFSILRDEENLISEEAGKKAKWSIYGIIAKDINSIIDSQDRETLDMEIDNDFTIKVLSRSKGKLYLSADGTLRAKRFSWSDRAISVKDAASKFGGTAVEDALEYGSYSTN